MSENEMASALARWAIVAQVKSKVSRSTGPTRGNPGVSREKRRSWKAKRTLFVSGASNRQNEFEVLVKLMFSAKCLASKFPHGH